MAQVDLKFIDLFAGIGGFRLGFENAGCKCVFSSEIDEHACRMYELNFGNNPYCVPITSIMVQDAYNKIKDKPVQRYYLLSTSEISDEERVAIEASICSIREEHGCQIIANGVFPTLKYYLRLLENSDLFLNRYIENLTNNTEINYEHKLAWNTLLESYRNDEK